MASRISRTDGPQVVGPHIPLNVILAAIPSLPRPVLSRLTSHLVERLDEMDGDSDVEPNGDEEDGTFAEDDFCLHEGAGAGCPVADPDCCPARDDTGTEGGGNDGLPGDPEDAEDGGDTELNGDEEDYSGGI